MAAAQEKAYTDAITKGNKLFAQKTYAEARISFQEAKKLKPTEPLPDEMIAKIDALIAENERKLVEAGQKEALYASFIKEGETSFKNKDYSEARNSFVKASGLKPDEPIPVRRIQDIDKILSDIALADAKNKAAELAYQEAIKLADQAFKLDQLDEAGNKYQLALTSKPNDQYANTQLDEISKRRAAILAEKALLKKLDEQYDASIKMAQDAFQKNKLKEARDAYQKAMGIKPSEPVPPARIAEIDKMIAQLDEAAKLAAMKDEQRLAKEKANKEQYDKAIASGDQSFTEKRYKDSRAFYTDALSIFPNENYPKTQISKIDNLIAQQQKDELLARANAIKDSISKANGNAFDQAMASAKVLEQSKQYQNAILKYKEAITINPGERTNVQKLIISLEDQIRLMAKQESQYKQSIAKADQLYAGKKLPDALTEYSNAANIKPTEDYPKTQIAEIQKTISERNASYDNAIKNGDKAFNESDWQSAKAAYTEASLVKPDEAYPPKRLKETNQKINEEKLAGIKNANESAAYNDAIAKAEKAFADDQLINAKMQFKVALSLKPNESVPAQRIKEIDAMIDQRNKDLLAQSQRDIDEKYRQAISVADNAFREKTYSIARLRYQEAKLIKPNESYPKDQIALIDQLMNVAAPVETYIKKLPEANTAQPTVPKTSNSAESTKTSTSQAQSLNADNDYTEAIRKADQSFGIKDYTSARFYYYKASDIKPKEEYPIKQIELIRKLIDSQLSDLDRAGYEQAITKADEAFSKQEYMIAKHFYNKALEIKSWEKYPKDRIQEILALTNSLLSEKLEKEYRDLIAKGDEAYVEKDISLARFYYNKALVIKTGEDYPRIKLKDIQKQIDQDDLDKIKLEYNKLIELGDEAMQKENFSIARYNYTKALNLKTDEKYPKDQLKLIKEALEKQKKPSIGTKN